MRNRVTRLVLILISGYQKTISRFLPARCRFYPTCSSYAIESIQNLPLGTGLLLSIWRILRCNPFTKGGFDPVLKIYKPKHSYRKLSIISK